MDAVEVHGNAIIVESGGAQKSYITQMPVPVPRSRIL
jgi:hypothetical protein